MPKTHRPIETQRDIEVNAQRFRRHLRAENLSPKTVVTYMEAVEFASFLHERGMPEDGAYIKREHVEAFIADLLERAKKRVEMGRTPRARHLLEPDDSGVVRLTGRLPDRSPGQVVLIECPRCSSVQMAELDQLGVSYWLHETPAFVLTFRQ